MKKVEVHVVLQQLRVKVFLYSFSFSQTWCNVVQIHTIRASASGVEEKEIILGIKALWNPNY